MRENRGILRDTTTIGPGQTSIITAGLMMSALLTYVVIIYLHFDMAELTNSVSIFSIMYYYRYIRIFLHLSFTLICKLSEITVFISLINTNHCSVC